MKKVLFFIFLFLLITVAVAIHKPALHKLVEIDANVNISRTEISTMHVEWNTWHSNLVNELMIRAKSAPDKQPIGTLNYIEFDVDSNQNIVNIKIYSEPEVYSKLAKKHFSPIVRNLDGADVLKFPTGTERKLVHFKAVLKKDKKTEFSSPDDFSDYETVKFKR